jgi:hypothetical protein
MSNNVNEICEIVISQKGNDKINVCGYLLVKEQARNDAYYWSCEKKRTLSCKGRAITRFSSGLHYLQKHTEHNHSPQATDGNVANTVARIKQQARETIELPIQIIQRNIANISEDTAPYMPTQNALRAKIKRVRNAEMAAQPQTIEDINIPESLQSSLNGDQFLIKDSTVREERILLFTTKANIRNLSQALFWVMDGTYKTVPNVFYQLYTIHAPVGAEDNSRILPLVYVLMTSKAEEVYKQLFKDLNDFANENDYN